MKTDLQTKEDVLRLVTLFYEKAIPDEMIGHFFTRVVQLDFSTHIPKIADFWSGILLGDRTYRGNPMEAHVHLHRKSPLEQQHFERWVELWTVTVQENFEGAKATEAIQRAENIAQLMFHNVQR